MKKEGSNYTDTMLLTPVTIDHTTQNQGLEELFEQMTERNKDQESPKNKWKLTNYPRRHKPTEVYDPREPLLNEEDNQVIIGRFKKNRSL